MTQYHDIETSVYDLIKKYIPDLNLLDIVPNTEYSDCYIVFDSAGELSAIRFSKDNDKHLLNVGFNDEMIFCDEVLLHTINIPKVLAMKILKTYFEYNHHIKTEQDVICDFVKYLI